MRLAVYAIMRNEAKNVTLWMETILQELRVGDELVMLDTGSTDGTLEAAALVAAKYPEADVRVPSASVMPWRFDVARNTALALVSSDVDAAWSLDLDEFPQPGWRQRIADAWRGDATRLRYKFVWNTLPDGRDGVVFYADKLHARAGFRWKGVAHEWLVLEGEERHVYVPDLVVIHRQDQGVERRDRDMQLMERAIRELPDDDRLQHYYARQLYFSGRMVEASEAFQRHLANPRATWREERSQSMLYLAKVGGNEAWNAQWLMRAAAEAPNRREVWYELAKWMRDQGDYHMAAAFARKAADLPRSLVYLSDPEAQGDGPQELLGHILATIEREEGDG